MKKIKLALGLVVIAVSVYGGYYLAQKESKIEYNSVVEQAVEETARRYETQIQEHKGDMKSLIIELENEVIARLQRDESGGSASGGDVFYTNDPQQALVGACSRIGGKRNIECDSWGVMQFKIPTIIYYYKELYGTDLSQKEAVVLALNDEKARELARDIIFKVEGGVWNWSAANNDSSYYAYQVPFIRSLIEKVESN